MARAAVARARPGRPRRARGDHADDERRRVGHRLPDLDDLRRRAALRKQPELAAEWEPRLTSLEYDGEVLKPADEKPGALFGMAMTESQGGSDVRANTTRAEPDRRDGEYALTGHKWFCSAPMSDGFLVLAQTHAGVTCFLLPRLTPDGTRNCFASTGSRTSSATARTRRARSSSTGPGRSPSARRAAASPRSSRWSTTRGSTACSARPV